MIHELKALRKVFYDIHIDLDANDISVRDSFILDKLSKDRDNLLNELSLFISKTERFESNLVKQCKDLSKNGIKMSKAMCNVPFNEDRAYLIDSLIIINSK